MLKRYGEKATIELLKKGGFIRYNDFFTLDGGYKLHDENGERVGFITCDLFAKLWKIGAGDLVKIGAGYSWTDYALPRVIEIEEENAEEITATETPAAPVVIVIGDDDTDDTDDAPTMDTPDTITPAVAYSVHIPKGGDESGARLLFDGFNHIVMEATRRSLDDLRDELSGNECARLCEIFSTASAKWAYWRDEEIDADYLTRLDGYGDPVAAYLVIAGGVRPYLTTEREFADIRAAHFLGGIPVEIFRAREEAEGYAARG